MVAEYSAHDRSRRLTEAPKDADRPAAGHPRSPFARDRARVLHSAALRGLAGKTQVVGPAEGAGLAGMPRTRLTHTLEVAQIGRELAEQLGCDPDVVDTAGLAHDIGHPPFGHNGESALDAAGAACGGFEANAQSLRILSRLEPKAIGPDGTPHGLNLTRACLDAAVKYPWPRSPGTTKFGVYADDAAVFGWLRDGAPPHRRCLEAQLVDWADDVAYSVHDVEDGVAAGQISLAALGDPAERAAVAGLAAKHFSPASVAELEAVAAELLRVPALAAVAGQPHDGSTAAQVALKRLTSELVGRFVCAAVDGTRAAYGPGPLRRYTAELVVPAAAAAEVALLKAMALRYVMSDEERLVVQRAQYDLLTELVALLAERAPGALRPALRPAWHAASTDAARLRVVLDQVAALTDAQALAWHAALSR